MMSRLKCLDSRLNQGVFQVDWHDGGKNLCVDHAQQPSPSHDHSRTKTYFRVPAVCGSTGLNPSGRNPWERLMRLDSQPHDCWWHCGMSHWNCHQPLSTINVGYHPLIWTLTDDSSIILDHQLSIIIDYLTTTTIIINRETSWNIFETTNQSTINNNDESSAITTSTTTTDHHCPHLAMLISHWLQKTSGSEISRPWGTPTIWPAEVHVEA